MGIHRDARFPELSADALPATLYGHFTQAIYRNRPIYLWFWRRPWRAGDSAAKELDGRGLHSSTFQFNLSCFGELPLSPCPIDWGKIMHPTNPTNCAYVEPKSGRV
jgi:hypothetical protein